MKNHNINLAPEKKAELSIFDLDFKGWTKYLKSIWCMISLMFIVSIMVCGIVMLILCSIHHTPTIWTAIYTFIGIYIVLLVCMYNASCKKCSKCELNSICKEVLAEKQKKIHTEYISTVQTNIDAAKSEIDRLRNYMDRLLKLDQTNNVKREIEYTLEKIASYEDRIKRYNEVIQ